jgi:hypothetical protein
MKYLLRNNDILTGQADLEELHTFRDFPVHMGVTDEPANTDCLADMRWMISPSSGIIQLNPLIPLHILYQDSHGSGTTGELWLQHHREFSEFVAKLNPKSILEIGGGHGRLATSYLSVNDASWTIVEPNPHPEPGCPARIIPTFFSQQILKEQRYDAVVHSHVLEHIYDPREFCRSIREGLQPGDAVIFSVPNLSIMLDRCYTNVLNFEHTFLLEDSHIQSLMESEGFLLESMEYFKEDHSVFYAYRASDPKAVDREPSDRFLVNRSRFKKYVREHQSLVRRLNSDLQETKSVKYLFGAHVFSQALINFGLGQSHFRAILDNDRAKQGKRLRGSSLTVLSPETIVNDTSPLIVLRAGVYNREISEQLYRLNPNVKIVS